MILFHKEPLLLNSGRLATGIRRCSAAKLVLKLHPKCGYFTPTAASLEQGCISPPHFSLAPIWHQLCRGRVRQEHDTKARPLAHSWVLRLSAPTGPWVQGKERSWSDFPALKWGCSHSEEAPDQRLRKTSSSPGRAWAPAARWGEDACLWMRTFVSAPLDSKQHLKQLEPAIYKSDWPNTMLLKIDMP